MKVNFYNIFKIVIIATAIIAISALGYVSKLLTKIDTLKSVGYIQVTSEELNDLSKNELSALIESGIFVEVDNGFYKKGE